MQATSGILVTSIVVLGALEVAAFFTGQAETSPQAPMQNTLQLAPFSSIEVPNNGHVVVRPAPTQSVKLVTGSLDYTRLQVTRGGVLVIDRCIVKCPRGYRLELEIMVPTLKSVSLANGGSIQSVGSFGRQAELTAQVSHGGTIDVRSMPADRVTASVYQGGGIFTVPRSWLLARITGGGAITYWGDPEVKSSVEHGGAVHRGRAGDINQPLSEVGSFPSPLHRKH
jgi:hypothetical protein